MKSWKLIVLAPFVLVAGCSVEATVGSWVLGYGAVKAWEWVAANIPDIINNLPQQ